LAETILTDRDLSIEEQYKLLGKQVKLLLIKDDNPLSSLSNFTAILKQSLEKISWIGFYLFDGSKLYLGPFQGKIACTNIEIGKGVCGTTALKKETIIVPDVDKFPGHIVCDADAKSEIVVPIFKGNNLFGVLDIDSNELNSFDEIDKKYLEELCNFISAEIL
jgi:GAF domain-containing protein